MAVPLQQAVSVGMYMAKKRIAGEKRFPMVLMLEPLYRCNLECAGCGKIQHPEEVLDTYLSPQECFDAAEECGAPVVSIAGGEPLVHPKIDEIAHGLVERKRFVYLCTNAILLKRWLPKLHPSGYLTLSVHLDGMRELHDRMVDREGVFDKAVDAIREAKSMGFRVTTNTTVFADSSPEDIRELFNFLMHDLKVDGLMVSPGYDYPKAPRQEVFLTRPKMIQTFREILSLPEAKGWAFNHSPIFLDFLKGENPMQCTPWGNPTRCVFGWQKPCYLMADGYAKTFKELMEETEWERYGYGRDNRCTNCMMHCGYEATSILATSQSLPNMLHAAKFALIGS